MTREEAIKILSEIKESAQLLVSVPMNDTTDIEALDIAINALQEYEKYFPTPKREKGEWIPNGSHTFAPVYRCSSCNESVAIIWGKKYKCCPSCGADMRAESEAL